MKSKTSFFNWPISKNLLKRCWPGWALYLFIVLAVLPMSINQQSYNGTVNNSILNSAQIMVFLSFFVAVAAAMALYSFMYNPRGTGMMATIPVKRETVYSTVFLTGIVPILLCNLIAVLLALPIMGKFLYGSASALWMWLLITSMANIAFFGFAAFCATLTGSIWVLPLVYVVLSLVVAVVSSCIEGVKELLCFGYIMSENRWVLLFSPIIYLMETSSVVYTGNYDAEGRIIDYTAYAFNNTAILAVYCAAGILFAAAGLLIYRKRRMESATDVVAVKCLKPVFKYCMAFGTALVFSLGIYSWLFGALVLSGRGVAALYLTLMLLGGFIGYFGAEMLMDKSMKVFRGNWKGFVAVAAVLVLLVSALETDVFRIERNFPKAEDVEKVSLGYQNAFLSERENIEKAIEIQRAIVDAKHYEETPDDMQVYYGVSLWYTMKDGTELHRNYNVKYSEELLADSSSIPGMITSLMDSREARISRASLKRVNIDGNITYFTVSVSAYATEDGKDVHKDFEIPLTLSELRELYKDCILPDAAEGAFEDDRVFFPRAQETPVATAENGEDMYISMQLSVSEETGNGRQRYAMPYENKYYSIDENAVRTLEWLAERMEISELGF